MRILSVGCRLINLLLTLVNEMTWGGTTCMCIGRVKHVADWLTAAMLLVKRRATVSFFLLVMGSLLLPRCRQP